jgi:hypothetical protein
MSADGATVAAARALGGGRGALSDSSVVPLARGVARAAHLAARSQALCGAAANEKHTSVQPSRGSHVSLSLCMGRAPRTSSARRARRPQPPLRPARSLYAAVVLGSSLSRRGSRFHLNPRGLRLGQFFNKDESHETASWDGATGHVHRRGPCLALGDLISYPTNFAQRAAGRRNPKRFGM